MKGFDSVSGTEVKRKQRNRASTSEPKSGRDCGKNRVALKEHFHHKSKPTKPYLESEAQRQLERVTRISSLAHV